MPGPAGSVWADAIGALTAAAGALGARFDAGEVPVWAMAAAISNGRLLAPGWPGKAITRIDPDGSWSSRRSCAPVVYRLSVTTR
jgi:hypothetical protein